MAKVEIYVPQWMKPEQVTETFTAYLLGRQAFNNADLHLGPHRLISCDNTQWRLDDAGNYCLKIEENRGTLSSRYEQELPTLKAMAVLFELNVVRQ